MIEGLEYVPLAHPELCCGFGGTFAVKMPRISTAMVDEKVDRVLATGADLLIGLDMSCLMNIEGRLRRRGSRLEVRHLAEMLAAVAAEAEPDVCASLRRAGRPRPRRR